MVDKLGRKATETDPTKQTYGPQMREKVLQLVERWAPIEGLAKDVLQQRSLDDLEGLSLVGTGQLVERKGVAVAPPSATGTWGAAPVPAAAHYGARAAVPGGAPPQAAAHSSAQRLAAVPAASHSPGAGAVLGGIATAEGSVDRREAAARAAEARSRGNGAPIGLQHIVAGDAQRITGAGTAVEGAAGGPLRGGPPVQRMEELLHLVHCVFLSQGYRRADGGTAGSSPSTSTQAGPFRVRYVHEEARAAPIVASYVPVQRHLIIYAALERSEGSAADGSASDVVSRATVQLGMAAASVQAKVDYLLVYPLVYRQCVPALVSIPPEVCFGLLASLALPALAALGAASRALAHAVFEDDVLWWRMVLALPPSEPLLTAIAKATDGQGGGEALPAGTCRRLVREEVERQRKEAEERRRRKEEAERMERMLRATRLRHPWWRS